MAGQNIRRNTRLPSALNCVKGIQNYDIGCVRAKVLCVKPGSLECSSLLVCTDVAVSLVDACKEGYPTEATQAIKQGEGTWCK